MIQFAAAIKRKPNWFVKFKDPVIRGNWRDEAVTLKSYLYFPADAAVWVLSSVEAQAALIDVDDPAAIRPSPVLHVWERDNSLGPELEESLNRCVTHLEESYPVDIHPGSSGLVRDLIHPSVYCYVSDVTPVADSVRAGQRSVAIPRPQKREESLRQPYLPRFKKAETEHMYQWLPSIYAVDDTGSARIESCIPGFAR
eukprot:m.181436 g.181436  ORF g.181436 m.181436 type:complete len:198 (+) comp14965_c0_seq2:516-1109(+)